MEYQDLYKITLELEGLALILRDTSIPNDKRDEIYRLIADKAITLKQSVTSLESILSTQQDTATDKADSHPDNTTEVAIIESTISNDSDISVPSVEDDVAIAANALFEETEDADIAEDENLHQPFPPKVPEDQIETMIPDLPDCSPTDTGMTTVVEVDNTASIDVNISAFAHKAKGDIRKYFTLNDNYKFRRELFGNSAERYSAALTYIESLPSLQSAKDYCFNILGWDKDKDEVNDFINIISAYFIK